MEKEQFLQDSNVKEFIEFLIQILPTIKINLRIKKSSKVPGGIIADVQGLSSVLDFYKWNSGHTSTDGTKVTASDWDSTKKILSELSSDLKRACEAKNEHAAQQVALQILKWGGDRNNRVGATVDIKKLSVNNQITSYLLETKSVFSENTIDMDRLKSIKYTGSMWTKIYALHSDNALPIYDSRVAMGIVGLVQLFHNENSPISDGKNSLLSFSIPFGTNWLRNQTAGCDLSNVKRISKDNPIWSRDTLKLSWIMDMVLEQSDLFSDQRNMVERKHGFEAALFMVGYDLRAIFR